MVLQSVPRHSTFSDLDIITNVDPGRARCHQCHQSGYLLYDDTVKFFKELAALAEKSEKVKNKS